MSGNYNKICRSVNNNDAGELIDAKIHSIIESEAWQVAPVGRQLILC